MVKMEAMKGRMAASVARISLSHGCTSLRLPALLHSCDGSAA